MNREEASVASEETLIGDLLKSWRQDNRLTQKQMSARLATCGTEYTNSIISKYEKNQRKPPASYFAHLKLCFSISEEEIMGWFTAMGITYINELVDDYQKIIDSN